jgi:hypothetical protein
MADFHGLDCDCCKHTIPAVKEILEEINKIVGPPGPTEVDKTIDSLKNLNSSEFAGKLNGLVKLSEAFLKVPIEQISVDQLKLSKADENRKIGKFKLKDLSDVPGLDVSKLVDFSSLNLNSFNSLKFGISGCTIEAEITIPIPALSVKMKFLVTRKGFGYFPVVNAGVKSFDDAAQEKFGKPFSQLSSAEKTEARAPALEKLKGVKFDQPISSTMDLNKAKDLAAKSYSSSKEVFDAVNSSSTTAELIDKLGKIGVFLTEEVDVEQQVNAILSNEEALKNVPVFEEPECGTVGVVPAPFNTEELKNIEKDCCSEEVESDLDLDGVPDSKDTQDTNAFFDKLGISESQRKDLVDEYGVALTSEIEKQLEELESEAVIDQDKALEDVNSMIDAIKTAGDNITNCAKEKQNALNNFYWYVEAEFLNQITLEYATARSNMLDALYGTFETLQAERVRRIERSIAIKNEERALLITASTALFPNIDISIGSSGSSSFPVYALDLGNVQITNQRLQLIEQNATYSQALTTLRNSYENNENRIQEISSLIQDQKAQLALPTFTQAEVQLLLTLGATYSSGLTPSILDNKTRTFKSFFDIATNPVSDQVGFTAQGSFLNLKVHPYILAESKTLFALNSPEQGDVENYLQPLDERRRLVATNVWNKYYSSRRVDLLFTYIEQGYTSPKPQFDDNGNALGPTKTITVVSPTGEKFEEAVAQSIVDIDINDAVAEEFWPNLEAKTLQKITILLGQVRNSTTYQNYIQQIRGAAENEAKYAYAANLIFQENIYTSRNFDNYTLTFSFNTAVANNSINFLNTSQLAQSFRNQYKMVYDSIAGFQNAISGKKQEIENFIELKKKCISDEEKAIGDAAAAFSEKTAKTLSDAAGPLAGAGTPIGAPASDLCPPRLGSDPLGLKPSGNCPGISKNCYWKEYTKIMQKVSLMPIPDDAATGALVKRLFRYYPVPIQIPVPSPAPVVLPTLASGIPDILISVPLPLVWKHIVSLNTPVGLFVIWIAVSGPVPSPYVMYIDEKMDPCFLVTGKGPYSIPAKELRITPLDDKSLLEILAPLPDTFKIPVSISPFNKILGGNNFIKTGDPDSPESFIDKIKEKIKAAADSIEATDPWTLDGETVEEVRQLKDRVNKALRNFPPDISAVEEALGKIEKVIDKKVDDMNIKSIKFPKDPKKLAMPVIGPAELVDTFNKLIDAGIKLPDIGLGIKIISLREKMKQFIDRELSTPEIKEKFAQINEEIAELEATLRISGPQGPDIEKITQRVKKLKAAIKAPVQKVADKISPELLGFISAISLPLPLPVPCYTQATLDPLPPYILALIAAVKALPAALDAISDEELAELIGRFMDLSVPLPRVDDAIFSVSQAFLTLVPDLKFPDLDSLNLLKQNIKTAVQNIFKIKIRLPRPGAIQITIPPAIIKEAIKAALKAAFGVVVALVIKELTEAVNNGDFVKVLAVAAIIKGIFGTDLGSVSGEDIKAFIVSSLESVNDYLQAVENLLQSFPKIDFKSIKETLFPTLPPKIELKPPYLEISTEAMLNAVTPLLQALQAVPFPLPVTLLAASQLPGRAVITKVYPFAAKELLPSWEKLSTKNVPFVIWLDQLVATAQKSGGLASNYVTPWWLPDA